MLPELLSKSFQIPNRLHTSVIRDIYAERLPGSLSFIKIPHKTMSKIDSDATENVRWRDDKVDYFKERPFRILHKKVTASSGKVLKQV